MKTDKPTTLAAALLLALALGGCSFAPGFTRPMAPVAAVLPGEAVADQAAVLAADLGWRDFFADPRLQAIIEMALANNRDLRETALNVEAFQAQYRIQRSTLFPTVDGGAGYVKQRTLGSGGHATSEAYSASVGVTVWEIDFFGRIRNLRDQALEEYLAMEENRRSAHISLVAEVARAYLTWLADRQLLAITEDTAANEQASYDLIKQRFEGGVATRIDLAQAQTSLQTARANQAQYRRLLEQDENLLTLLAGGPLPDDLPPSTDLAAQALLGPVPTGLRSDLLLQRPDIMAAEHTLRGANASIGAARAAFFPAISLTADAGVISAEASNLFDGDTGSWLFAPSLRLPIFTGGRLSAQLDLAEVRKEIAVTRYEQAIQTAFRETADVLAGIRTFGDQLQAEELGLQANQTYYALARERYDQGVDSYLVVLDAQRSLYRARQSVVVIRLAKLMNRVNLYKVLGGGWKAES
ncbi:MAG: efflux transporter outer membrane subunit [Desulfoprunum sp.]|jgi:multidrug efflux system outer membrane protein|uniref:efflux transporter outer membrane subunit n=1 Tax=Desulfoprunum sp. TaxID=2020866 RepID=UPI00068D60CB